MEYFCFNPKQSTHLFFLFIVNLSITERDVFVVVQKNLPKLEMYVCKLLYIKLY